MTRRRVQVALVAMLCGVAPARLVAQHVEAGGGYAIGEYGEQTSLLSFRGSGPTASAAVDLWRVTVAGEWTQLDMDPASNGSGLSSFTLTDIDVGVRYRVHPLVSAEVALQRRSISPTVGAQEFAAVRVGARAEYPLAPGALVTARLGYVGASSFSGGGSAPFGAALGLGFAYGLSSGRVRMTGDYGFERVGRRTTVTAPAPATVSVPIQSSIGRLGVVVRL
jgi:hypothetical protein